MRRISPTAFQIARRGTSREINRQIALNLIRSRQPISRAELARLMGVRRGAVSLLVNELLASKLVFEGAKGESKRGRKPMHLHIETRKRCALAVDISVSHVSILVTDLLGHTLGDVTTFPTPDSPNTLVNELALRIGESLKAHPEGAVCAGIGVVISGVVEEGCVRYSPTLGWRDVDLAGPLQAATRIPVVVENSVKACVLGQVWAVRGDSPVDGPVAFVNVADGVGVGIAIDGKLLRGVNSLAGEFGHVPLSVEGPLCSCGQRGCWEAYISKRATIARYLGTDPWEGPSQHPDVTVEGIIARARGGEERAQVTLQGVGYDIGRGLATLIKAIDPSRIYVGGEITAAWDLIAPSVARALRERALIPESADTEFRVVPLGEHPRLRGAAALVGTPAFAAPDIA
jgi:predicted NBD/HSP70 family sugar kinase